MLKIFGFIKNKLGFLLAVSLATAVGGATTGLVMAAIPDSSGVIHGCIRPANDNLRIIDTEAGQTCTAGQTPISWDRSAGGRIVSNQLTVPGSTSGQQILDIPGLGEFIVSECTPTSQIGYHNNSTNTVEFNRLDTFYYVSPDTSFDLGSSLGDRWGPFGVTLSYQAGGVNHIANVTLSGFFDYDSSACRFNAQAVISQN